MKRHSTASSILSKDKSVPLHRSMTDEHNNTYNDHHPSPFTRFVSKLLGLKKTDHSTVRPRPHKSHSTTSITKSSVILSSSYHTTSSSTSPTSPTTTADHENELPKRKTAISFAIPDHPKHTKCIDTQKDEDETSSILSTSLISVSSMSSSVSSFNSAASTSFIFVCANNNKNTTTAIDVLTNLATAGSARSSFFADFDLPPIMLQDRKLDTEPVLTENIAEMVRPYIPRRYRVASSWKLLYSLDQHGVSLYTLYSLTRDYDGPCILIIKDAENHVYGAYLSHTLACQHNVYYGTGECFLWKLTSDHIHPCNKEDQQNQQQQHHIAPKIKVFPWTGKNDYMILCNSDFIAIGGGEGRFGLWLNSDLEKGYSTTCPTFDNECLASKPQFQCMELEVWGLVS
ncbi:hypothetical protein RMCBS344292_00853 [Rhizopus microsporus]|nr:hypothetical protein RMCBS344292_00853 [Rhizopus microsporus]